jgi:hypothetical protein
MRYDKNECVTDGGIADNSRSRALRRTNHGFRVKGGSACPRPGDRVPARASQPSVIAHARHRRAGRRGDCEAAGRRIRIPERIDVSCGAHFVEKRRIISTGPRLIDLMASTRTVFQLKPSLNELCEPHSGRAMKDITPAASARKDSTVITGTGGRGASLPIVDIERSPSGAPSAPE